MNRAQRRAKEKLERKHRNAVYNWGPPIEKPKPPVPGVDCPPEIPEFTEMVNRNQWHDKSELDGFIKTIKQLATRVTDRYEDDNNTLKPGMTDWSWARNWNCKYINLRIDMRDGGFILTNDKQQRINLEQLLWQYKIENEDENS